MAKKPSKDSDGRKIIATNRKARHEYEILDTFEAGMSLLGPEVKSLRAGQANLNDAYVIVRGGEVLLINSHISPYKEAGRENPEERRPRKLLLHRYEIDRLTGKIQERGFTVVPLALYFKNGRVKAEIALVRGKKLYDKRETIKKRDQEREMQRAKRARH